jgi:hypothetical protein
VACIAHKDVAISDGVHFVNFVLDAQLIKPGEQFGEKFDDLPWIFHAVAELCEAHHVSKQ